MALCLQFLAQFQVVVNLAITNHPDGSIFVADRLGTALDVDNRESQMTKQAAPIHQCHALSPVGPSMLKAQLRLFSPSMSRSA